MPSPRGNLPGVGGNRCTPVCPLKLQPTPQNLSALGRTGQGTIATTWSSTAGAWVQPDASVHPLPGHAHPNCLPTLLLSWPHENEERNELASNTLIPQTQDWPRASRRITGETWQRKRTINCNYDLYPGYASLPNPLNFHYRNDVNLVNNQIA